MQCVDLELSWPITCLYQILVSKCCMAHFQPVDGALLFTRNDPGDKRLGEFVQTTAPCSAKTKVSVVGYPDDEGIKLNSGRPGSALGPSAIRNFLYRTTPHSHLSLKSFQDLGDLKVAGLLKDRHEIARNSAVHELASGRQLLALGGGNDYAYSDGMAFLDQFNGQRPLIINIDAHFDVRSTENGLSSGTPFYRLLESGVEFDFVELGIQSLCNAKSHWDYVLSKKGKIITQEEILESGQTLHAYCMEALADWILRPRPTFLAIDIDAFAWPYAAGSSAAWPLGIEPQSFWPFYVSLLKRLNIHVLGIYEVAPNLEQGPGTAKLAAQLAHRFLHV
jgi:formiminoglutamase